MTILPQLERDLIALGDRPAPLAARARVTRGLASLASVAVVLVVALLLVGALRRESHPVQPLTRPQAALVAVLGVLRAPQTPDAAAFAHRGWPTPPLTHTSLDRSLIRRATITPWGATVYIVPIAPPGNPILARELGEVAALWVDGIGWSDFATTQEITGGIAWGPGRTVISHGRRVYRFFEIVPDGVARVVFSVTARIPDPGRPAHFTAQISAPVRDNIAVFQTGQPGPTGVFATWYSGDGRIIKRVGDWGLLTTSLAKR